VTSTAEAPAEAALTDARPARLEHYGVAQVFGAIALVLLLVAVAGLVAGLLALGRLADRRTLLVDRLDVATLAALRLSNALLDEETGVRGYALGGVDTYLEPYQRGRVEEDAAVRRLRSAQMRADLGPARAALAAVEAAADAWRSGYAQPTIAAIRAGERPPPDATGKARFDRVRSSLDAQDAELRRRRAAARSELDDAAALVTVLFLASGGVLLIALAVAAYALRRVIIVPLARLADGVRAVSREDLGRSVEPTGPREIAQLGRDVEAMRLRIVAEVDALRQAERALIEQARELQRSNEELEQFAYVASHDLQEPLRKVASFTQMLERRYKGQLDERADSYIAFAVDGAKRMQELINDLLDFSRVGRVGAEFAPVDVGEAAAAARVRVGQSLEETGGEIVLPDDLPVVEGDAGLLTALFANLFSNGLKFRGEDPPRIVIDVVREGRYWRFRCTDNGIGVEDEYAERIFVIFQRLHTRDTYQGTGIGLAMCRKIVEHHGGRMWLDRADPGRGARFVFTIPAADNEEVEQS
jgi:signal transduction histidine kinase